MGNFWPFGSSKDSTRVVDDSKEILLREYNTYMDVRYREISLCLAKYVQIKELHDCICEYIFESMSDQVRKILSNDVIKIPYKIKNRMFVCELQYSDDCEGGGLNFGASMAEYNVVDHTYDWRGTSSTRWPIEYALQHFNLDDMSKAIAGLTRFALEGSPEFGGILSERGVGAANRELVRIETREATVKILNSYVQNAKNYLSMGDLAKQNEKPDKIPIMRLFIEQL